MADLLELNVRSYNMYQTGRVITFPSDGEKLLVRDKIQVDYGVFDQTHTIKQNETIRNIAYQYYKGFKGQFAGNYWWVIADANDIYCPLDLSDLVGTEIIIPSLSNVELSL